MHMRVFASARTAFGPAASSLAGQQAHVLELDDLAQPMRWAGDAAGKSLPAAPVVG
jgi:hypothetical protein